MQDQTAITYVVSQYPSISHTFILGEINGLVEKGIKVYPTSVNNPDRPYDKLTKLEQDASDATCFIKTQLKKKLFGYVLSTLTKHPVGFFSALFMAIKFGLNNPVTLIKNIAYWLEAMVVADIATKSGSSQIHAHFSSQGCTVALLASKISGINFSVTVHGPDEFYNVKEFQLETKFALANFIICISNFARSQVMKFTAVNQWHKLHVNNLGVDPALFKPEAKSNDVPKLLCIGRLVGAKGQGVLLEAAKILAERNVSFSLDFVGDGPDRQELEHYVTQHQLSKQVNFLGKVNHDQVQVLQRQSDIFVIPSFAEGIPIVLMEAMASGTPCVTTHITGIPELITNGVDSLLIPAGSSELLADALQKLIDDPQLREQLAAEAVKTIREKWNIHDSNARLADMFAKLLKH